MPFENDTINKALSCRCGFVANSTQLLQVHNCRVTRTNYSNPHNPAISKFDTGRKKLRERTIQMNTRNLGQPTYFNRNNRESSTTDSTSFSNETENLGNVTSRQFDSFQFVDRSDDETSNFDSTSSDESTIENVQSKRFKTFHLFECKNDEKSKSNEKPVELLLSEVPGLCGRPNSSDSDPANWSSDDTSNSNQYRYRDDGPTETEHYPEFLLNREPKLLIPCYRNDENNGITANVPDGSRPTLSDQVNDYKLEIEALKSNWSCFFNTFAFRCDEDNSDGQTDEGGSTTDSLAYEASSSDLD